MVPYFVVMTVRTDNAFCFVLAALVDNVSSKHIIQSTEIGRGHSKNKSGCFEYGPLFVRDTNGSMQALQTGKCAMTFMFKAGGMNASRQHRLIKQRPQPRCHEREMDSLRDW